MAVFRVQKTQNYTIMSNHHLRNKALSLKAKGLLSLMLSLPEDWDYTTRGLASICKEGVDSVCATVRELEEHIQYVLDCLKDNPPRIRNIKQYLLAALYNAPLTIENYYAAQIDHELCGRN